MNTRILMVLKVSMLLPWLLPVDRSEYVNRHITSRSLVCFKKEAEGPKNVRKGIELTASTFSENFILTPQNEPKNPKVKFTLKIFNIRIQSFEQIEIYEEGELSNFWDFNEEGRYKKGGDSQEVEISKLLGFSGEPCDGTHSEECSKRRAFKEKYGTCLQGITVDITFSRGRLDTHSPDMLQAIHVKLKGEKTGTFTSFEGDFPFELEVMSIMKRELHDELINEISREIINSGPMCDKFNAVENDLKKETKSFLRRKDRDKICNILNALQDRFKSFTDIELEILRYKWFLSAISEDPRSFGHYCYEGLINVYDPFRSALEYYLAQPEAEDKRPSMCSELLIPHLKSLLEQGEEMLNYLETKSFIEIEHSTDYEDIVIEPTTFFSKKLSKYVDSKWEKDRLKRDTLRKTLDYFETIIQEYQGNQGESELKVNPNPLQSLDVIFKGLLKPLEDSSLFSVEDCFNCFKLDQGCVLTNYLKLCSEVTRENWDMGIQLPDLLEQQEVESLTFVKKPMFELIKTFYGFFENQIDLDNKQISNGQNTRINSNINALLENFQLNCAQAYYTNKPFNVLKEYMTQDDYGLPTVDKTTEEFENDAGHIFESVLENFKKIVGLPGNTNLLGNFCDGVLIQECFGIHCEKYKKLAGVKTLLVDGAQSILSTVLKNLTEERDARRDENEKAEQLNHLIKIGRFIENLLTHSKNYRYLEIIQKAYERNSKSTGGSAQCNERSYWHLVESNRE